ncbi:MAG TPA: protein kinase [Gemmatimonadales bacterium]|nr:protein kinase [Gemmatimonadales bacterium]
MTPPVERLAAALADRYRLERELGAGGMATVYLAHDLKHDRKVALKVLRPELAAVIGAERFVVEIRTTAALQHPHILPLFDSGTADGFLFYVMPYIEGETLRDKLNRETQLAIDDAVRITTDVADALDYAHRHGVIHRDIKPENILLHDGRPVVADFGIALALSAAAGGRMTETGMSLGTPHYMSPEQATAEKEITGRSDIYSLGSVLYEMLTGQPPHLGGSAQQIIMKIIAEPVRPVTALRRSVPPNVAEAVAKAVEKLPADRFDSAKAFATALHDPGFRAGVAADGARTAVPVGLGWRDWRAWSAAAVLVAAAALLGRWSAPVRRAAPVTARFSIAVDSGRYITNGPVNALALSPNGQTIVYVGRTATSTQVQLYTRPFDGTASHPVSGTEGASYPAFSPDGRRLAYIGPGGVYAIDVPLVGGTSAPIVGSVVQALSGMTWLNDNTLVASSDAGDLITISLSGTSTIAARPDRAVGEKNLYPEAALPDGRTMLVLPSHGSGIVGPVVAVDTRSGRRTPILDGPANAVWYADGALLWGEPNGAIRGALFDPGKLKVLSAPVTIADSVQQEIGGGPQAGVSANGSLVYVPESPLSLVLADHAGKERVLAEGHRFHSPRFSPDGSRLALDFTQQGSRSVWILDLGQLTLRRLSFDNDGHDPVWSRDGKWVAYEHNGGIWRRRSDGSGDADSVYTGPGAEQVLEYAPDGSMLGASLGTRATFGVVHLSADTRKIEPLVSTDYSVQEGTLSPDGRWMAYLSDETGRYEVYVQPFPGGAKTLVSQGGGIEVRWGPDGRTLYYDGLENGRPTLIEATVRTAPDFGVLKRTPLFDASDFEPAEPHANWDISPDGARFVMAHQAPFNTLAVVLGWTEEVRRHSAATR